MSTAAEGVKETIRVKPLGRTVAIVREVPTPAHALWQIEDAVLAADAQNVPIDVLLGAQTLGELLRHHADDLTDRVARPEGRVRLVAYGRPTRKVRAFLQAHEFSVLERSPFPCLRKSLGAWQGDSDFLAFLPTGAPELALAVDRYLLGAVSGLSDLPLTEAPMPVGRRRGQFQLLPGVGAKMVGGTATSKHLVVPGTVAGMGILSLGAHAFAGQTGKTAYLSGPLRWVGDGAFKDSPKLESVLLPDTVLELGAQAFAGCPRLRDVRLSRRLRVIGGRAFAGCPQLLGITLPGSVTTISEDAFAGHHPDLVVSAPAGSYALRWAKQQGIQTEALETAESGTPSPTYEQLTTDRVFTEGGITYFASPGGQAEVVSVAFRVKRRNLSVPPRVRGLKVVGVAADAIPPFPLLQAVILPQTMQWLAPGAIRGIPSLREVVGIDQVPLLFPGSVPARFEPSRTAASTADEDGPAGPDARRPLDVDSIRLTMRMICTIVPRPLPDGIDPDAPFPGLSAGVLGSSPGDLYFVRSGARNTSMVDRLVEAGMRNFVATRKIVDSNGTSYPTLVTKHPSRVLITLTRWLNRQYDAKVLAITGSIGKTTTKDMVYLVCQTALRTWANPGNANAFAQVSRHIQQQTLDLQVLIQETGAAFPGLVESEAKMLTPDGFIITNIGLNHVGKYGGKQENILADKLSHDDYLRKDGVAFVCYDDKVLREVVLKHPVISYSAEGHPASYRATDVVEEEGKLRFKVHEPDTDIVTEAVVHAFGIHNVANALVAFAVGRWLGIDRTHILEGLAAYRGSGLRQNFTHLGEQRVLVDCYNASEGAAHAFVRTTQTLSPGPGGKHRVVFADIDDKLGEHTEAVHRRVGQDFAEQQGVDKYYLFGPHSKWIYQELKAAGKSAYHAEDREDLEAALRADLSPEDVVAFKGGQQMALSITIDHLFGTSFITDDYPVLQARGHKVVEGGVEYEVISEYGARVHHLAADFSGRALTFLPEVDGAPLLMVSPYALKNKSVRKVVIPAPVQTIGTKALSGCRWLTALVLPPTLLMVEDRALEDCTRLKSVTLPDGLTSLGEGAFAGCRDLKHVHIPASVVSFGEGIFRDCPKLTVTGAAGSAAEAYCRRNGIPFKVA